jgi:hypothetical protein
VEGNVQIGVGLCFLKNQLYERNLKIDVVLKASCASFSLNEAPLGFISDYFPYFEKNKYIFQYHNNKV